MKLALDSYSPDSDSNGAIKYHKNLEIWLYFIAFRMSGNRKHMCSQLIGVRIRGQFFESGARMRI